MKHILHGCLALLFTFVISAFAATPPPPRKSYNLDFIG